MTHSGLPAEALVGVFDHESLTYGTRQYMDFADLNAQERYHWEVVGPEAYPLPWPVPPGAGSAPARRPSAWE